MFPAAMVALTEAICWKVVAKTVDSSGIGLVMYQKPVQSSCYEKRKENNPPLCNLNNRPKISWYNFRIYDIIDFLTIVLIVVIDFFFLWLGMSRLTVVFPHFQEQA